MRMASTSSAAAMNDRPSQETSSSSTCPVVQPPPYKAPHHLDRPRLRRTSPLTWLLAIVFSLVWVLIILTGIAVVIVYLIFRPKTPRLELSSATLNAAYVDSGALLNADLTVLANFSNPNHKVDVSYDYLALDLYYNGTLIAAQGIDPFEERRMQSGMRSVELVASQVVLPSQVADALRTKVENGNTVEFDLKGNFKVRSIFGGGFVKVTYWLHARCHLVVSAPPNGALLSSQCTTSKR